MQTTTSSPSHLMTTALRLRRALIAQAQDVTHYLLGATGATDSHGRESTFENRTLAQRLDLYRAGVLALTNAIDIALDIEKAIGWFGSLDERNPLGQTTDKLQKVADSLREEPHSEREMKAEAKRALKAFDAFCAAIQIDGFNAGDLRTGGTV